MYFDFVDEKWVFDLDLIDMVVLLIGYWYLYLVFYFDGDLELGCYFVEGVNCIEIGFFDVFGKVFNIIFKVII